MTSHIQTAHAPHHGTDILDGFGAGVANLVSLFSLWADRDRQRLHLAGLDGRMLNDIGVSKSAASREIAKPFWTV
ncbi:MAG: DUF1127 domain-containing protein [Alphaproteobacteria bacterium]|jgi:uncharacterized protein YjiS (DUF1127 family)